MNDLDEITTLVINYRTPDLLQKCIGSFLLHYPGRKMMIVDNGSDDNSITIIRQIALQNPNVQFIFNSKNIYHGPALDQGLRAVQTRFAFTLDSDCEVIRSGFLENMLPYYSDPRCYAVGELMYMNRFGYKLSSDQSGSIRYIHPSSMLVDRTKYAKLRKFSHHGSPCLANMKDAARAGYSLVDFPIGDYIFHSGRGTCSRYGYSLGIRHLLEYLINRAIH